MPKIRTCLGGAAVLIFLKVATNRATETPKLPVPPIYGHPIAYTWAFQGLDSVTHSMSEYQGHVLIISHWATWCGPCKAELPALSKLYHDIHGKPIDLLCLTNEGNDAVRKWLNDHPTDLPIFTYIGLPPKELSPSGYPTTYVVNRQGYVILKQVGSAQWDDPSVLSALEELSQ